MPWVRLDDGFDENPKIVAAGVAATGLYAMSLSYCARYITEGFIPTRWAHFHGGKRLADKLVHERLWERCEGGYLIPDFLEFNPTADEVEERRLKRAEAGRIGGKRSAEVRKRRHGTAQPPKQTPKQTASNDASGTLAAADPEQADFRSDIEISTGDIGSQSIAANPHGSATPPKQTPNPEPVPEPIARAAAELTTKDLPAAAQPDEPPRATRIREVAEAFGGDSRSWREIEPAAVQLDTITFERIVTTVKKRRRVDDRVALLIKLLRDEAADRQTAALTVAPPTPLEPDPIKRQLRLHVPALAHLKDPDFYNEVDALLDRLNVPADAKLNYESLIEEILAETRKTAA